jgi:hypothetical protein
MIGSSLGSSAEGGGLSVRGFEARYINFNVLHKEG